MVIDGIFAESAMLPNPPAVSWVDGQPLKETISIDIRGKLKPHKGVQYRLEDYESGDFAGYPSWQAPEAQQPFQYKSFIVVTEIIEPMPAKDGALIAPQFDPIAALAKELHSNPLWPNGEAPIISLASNAAPAEVVARAVEMWGFNAGYIKTYQLREVRQTGLDARPGCSAALIESALGKKILLFKYEQHDKTDSWWTRFYNAPGEAESNRATNAVQPRFALYLVKVRHAEVAKTELDNEPLLSEQDILTYRWQTHSMTLTKSGEKKIPQMKAVETFGKEFIVVADGQRCYRGAFWYSFSSSATAIPLSMSPMAVAPFRSREHIRLPSLPRVTIRVQISEFIRCWKRWVNLRTPNQAVHLPEASRFAQGPIERHRRLASVADLLRFRTS